MSEDVKKPNLAVLLAAVAIVVVAIGGGGYWLGANRGQTAVGSSPEAGRRVLYWYDPMVPNQHFDHAATHAPCASCHDNSQARGQPIDHFQTSLQCDTCHRTGAWTPVTYSHSSPAYVAHGGTLDCASCHTTGRPMQVWKNPIFKPDCAGCHANQFVRDSHKKTESPTTVFYTVSELRDCAGSCHLYTNNTFTTIRTSRTGHHRSSATGW